MPEKQNPQFRTQTLPIISLSLPIRPFPLPLFSAQNLRTRPSNPPKNLPSSFHLKLLRLTAIEGEAHRYGERPMDGPSDQYFEFFNVLVEELEGVGPTVILRKAVQWRLHWNSINLLWATTTLGKSTD
ncbi:uncharacterized protein LOC111375577 [Olea europaea var. sylvestris]|uniref:uncharacterized protein LOC111375577 n=1 Tax=Olea europaea var. sylvestris TaxID=158386 RepID=UPI000C1D7B97|nr:uncharacterized protein LOC111375577 [Olea europaea var. sylvestris]